MATLDTFDPADKIELLEDINFDLPSPGAGPNPIWEAATPEASLRGVCVFKGDLFINPELIVVTRSWSAPSAPPDWPDEAFAASIVDGADGYLSIASVTNLGGIGNFNYTQSKYRWRWAMADQPQSWDFAHYRWREAEYNPDSAPARPADANPLTARLEFAWSNGGLLVAVPSITFNPVNYNPDDPLTYPGSAWIEATMPTTVPPDLQTVYNRVRMVWPPEGWLDIPRCSGNVPGTLTLDQLRNFTGRVPGGIYARGAPNIPGKQGAVTNYSPYQRPWLTGGKRLAD